MARTDDDTWDLASSVGATATMVASARAMASKVDSPLIDDPYAEPLVRAVGLELFTKLATGELSPADLEDDSDGAPAGVQRMTDNMAVRTKFFDEFFIEATRSGIRQAVILASGLDARAYRLPWPDGTTVYEIDQPQVIEFKSRTLAQLGAKPTAHRRAVAVDLRDDWPTALQAAGFDPGQPSAWSAEGLLGYLPPDAQDRTEQQNRHRERPFPRQGPRGADQRPHADGVTTLEQTRTRPRHDTAGLLRRSQRGIAVPVRSRLGDERQHDPGVVRRQRSCSHRRG